MAAAATLFPGTEEPRPMAIRSNHYDAAFEELLRDRRVPYVSVDEKRRALLADASLKSFDFIVDCPGRNLLVDVKGRRWGARGRRWENWATEDDIASMVKWEGVFGDGFRAALVFAYHFEGDPPAEAGEAVFEHAGRRYFFSVALVGDYLGAMKPRSGAWNTVTVGAEDYRLIRRPLDEVLAAGPAAQ